MKAEEGVREQKRGCEFRASVWHDGPPGQGGLRWFLGLLFCVVSARENEFLRPCASLQIPYATFCNRK